MRSSGEELEAENTRLAVIVEQAEISHQEQLRILNEQQQTTSAMLGQEQLLKVRDRILSNWRIAKAPEKKERIKESLDRFIEAITESIQISTPGQDHDTSN